MHDVTNIQVKDPVLAILDSKSVSYIEFESLVFLDVRQLLQRGERDLEPLAPISKILLTILLDHILIAIYCRLVSLIFKLLDNTCQLLK